MAAFPQQLPAAGRAAGSQERRDAGCRGLCFAGQGGGSAVSSPRHLSNWLLLITWFIVFPLHLFWGYQFASQLELSNDWWDILFKFILQCERPFLILNKTKAISCWEATDFPAHTTQLALMFPFKSCYTGLISDSSYKLPLLQTNQFVEKLSKALHSDYLAFLSADETQKLMTVQINAQTNQWQAVLCEYALQPAAWDEGALCDKGIKGSNNKWNLQCLRRKCGNWQKKRYCKCKLQQEMCNKNCNKSSCKCIKGLLILPLTSHTYLSVNQL